jgi:hypothetical protein
MGAAAGAAIAAAIANAVKASGVIVHVSAVDFQTIVRKIENPLIVYNEGGFFSKSYRYLTSYKGLAFYCKTKEPILLPNGVELVVAKSIWMPQ